MDKKYHKYFIVGLLFIGLFLHFLYFEHPSQVVFDEIWYGRHVNDYVRGTFHFDGHPPLARMTIGLFSKMLGYPPTFTFENIGQQFPDKGYLILRFLPSVAGSLLPLIIYLILLELGITPLIAFVGGLLVGLDNAILTQSRFLLMDAFLLLYGFIGILFYLKYRRTKKYYLLILSGIFAIFSFSVKWVGLSYLALIGLFEFWDIVSSAYIQWKNKQKLQISRRFWQFVLAVVVIPLITYFLIITAYSSLLHKSGTGDAFMSPEYQKTLDGNMYQGWDNIEPANAFEKFYELNTQMYKVNQGLSASHPYASSWYTWPTMKRLIFYWQNNDERIYLIGNPIIWWFSTIAIILLLLEAVNGKAGKNGFIISFLLVAYVLNMVPFMGVKRIMFLYHYFTAYIFAIMAMVYFLNKWDKIVSHFRVLLVALLIASIVVFLYFAPLTYGLNLDIQQLQNRQWFQSWI
jgi:dolichyl-phosphate-mannose--protein O-mannosyl transferase